MKKKFLPLLLMVFLSGCSIAEKTEQLGAGMSNVGHPAVMLPGMAIAKIGNMLK